MKWELYRPVGMEWYQEGFWNVFPHIDTARQYLDLHAADHATEEGRRRLSEGLDSISRYNEKLLDGTYLVYSPLHEKKYKAITLPLFKQKKFDIIICSMPQHLDCLLQLRDQFQPQAKFVYQVGNNWIIPRWVPNVLSSAKGIKLRGEPNIVYYHQEFNAKAFEPDGTRFNPRTMISMTHYMQEPELFFGLERALSNWTFKAYGAGNRDLSVNPPHSNIINTFKTTGFVMHIKKEGDGFGYNGFSACAAGKPLVLRKSHFRGMTIEPFLTDGETCIDIDEKPTELIIDLLEKAASDYQSWSSRVLTRFKEVVNFDKEAENIRSFFGNLR